MLFKIMIIQNMNRQIFPNIGGLIVNIKHTSAIYNYNTIMLEDFHIFPQSFSHTHCPLGSAMSKKRSSDWLRHEKIFFFMHLQSITKSLLSLCVHPPKRQCQFFSASIQNMTKTDRTSAVTEDSLGTQSG